MTIYSYIYDFFYQLIGYGTGDYADFDLHDFMFDIGGFDIRLNSWLCHTFSIISIGLILIFLIIFIKWLFKLFGGLFKW